MGTHGLSLLYFGTLSLTTPHVRFINAAATTNFRTPITFGASVCPNYLCTFLPLLRFPLRASRLMAAQNTALLINGHFRRSPLNPLRTTKTGEISESLLLSNLNGYLDLFSSEQFRQTPPTSKDVSCP